MEKKKKKKKKKKKTTNSGYGQWTDAMQTRKGRAACISFIMRKI